MQLVPKGVAALFDLVVVNQVALSPCNWIIVEIVIRRPFVSDQPKPRVGGQHDVLIVSFGLDFDFDVLIIRPVPLDQWAAHERIVATLGTAMMPHIDYPRRIVSIVIAGQNDAAGRAAVEKAEEELIERGYATRVMWPAEGFKDWNDQLRGIRA